MIIAVLHSGLNPLKVLGLHLFIIVHCRPPERTPASVAGGVLLLRLAMKRRTAVQQAELSAFSLSVYYAASFEMRSASCKVCEPLSTS